MNITEDDIIKACEKMEKVIKPYAIFCNPKDEEEIREKLKDKFAIVAHPAVEQRKFYIVDRKQYEWYLYAKLEG